MNDSPKSEEANTIVTPARSGEPAATQRIDRRLVTSRIDRFTDHLACGGDNELADPPEHLVQQPATIRLEAGTSSIHRPAMLGKGAGSGFLDEASGIGRGSFEQRSRSAACAIEHLTPFGRQLIGLRPAPALEASSWGPHRLGALEPSPCDRRKDELRDDPEHDEEEYELDHERPVRNQEVRRLRNRGRRDRCSSKHERGALLLLVEDEDEEGHEADVDEVGRFTEADDDEHQGHQPTLGLGLTGDAGDRLATGEAVTNGCADGAAAEREAAADHCACELNRLPPCCRPLLTYFLSFVDFRSLARGSIGLRLSSVVSRDRRLEVQDGQQREDKRLQRPDKTAVEGLPDDVEHRDRCDELCRNGIGDQITSSRPPAKMLPKSRSASVIGLVSSSMKLIGKRAANGRK